MKRNEATISSSVTMDEGRFSSARDEDPLLPLSYRATEPFQRWSWFRKGGDSYRNRIETVKTVAIAHWNKNTQLTISTRSCFCAWERILSAFYPSAGRITLGSGRNLRGKRVTRLLKCPLIMQIERLPRSLVFNKLAFPRRIWGLRNYFYCKSFTVIVARNKR